MSQKPLLHSYSRRKVWLWSAGLFLILVIFLGGGLVFRAYADISSAHQAVIQTRNAAKTQAILDKDYEAWASLETDVNIKSQINASNFAAFSEAYQLLERGKIAEADVIRRQVNLKEERTSVANVSLAITHSIANRDYQAWRSLVGSQVSPTVNESNFDRYASALIYIDRGEINKSFSTLRSLNLKGGVDFSSSR